MFFFLFKRRTFYPSFLSFLPTLFSAFFISFSFLLLFPSFPLFLFLFFSLFLSQFYPFTNLLSFLYPFSFYYFHRIPFLLLSTSFPFLSLMLSSRSHSHYFPSSLSFLFSFFFFPHSLFYFFRFILFICFSFSNIFLSVDFSLHCSFYKKKKSYPPFRSNKNSGKQFLLFFPLFIIADCVLSPENMHMHLWVPALFSVLAHACRHARVHIHRGCHRCFSPADSNFYCLF